jgi:hypothetical protein
MKLSEIKTAIDGGKRIEALDINVKTYLPIVEKMIMIQGFALEDNTHANGIIDESIEFNNDMAYVDYFKKEISIICNMISWYTDIEIDDVEIENTLYDFYMTSGIWDYVKLQLNNEYKTLIDIVELSIKEELRKHNSMEAVINNNLIRFISRIPNDKELKQLVKSVIKDVNKVDWNKVPILKQMFDTIQGKKSE